MVVYILGQKTSQIYISTTATKLAKLTGFTHVNSLAKLEIDGDHDILIRYGLTTDHNEDFIFKKVINNARAMRLAINKLRSLQLLRQYNIPIPEVYLRKEDITKKCLPVVRRKKFHARGTDIVIIKSMRKMVDGDYYTQFIKGEDEYRVHVFQGEPIRIQKKIGTDGVNKRNKDIHNFENGFVISDHFEHNVNLEKHLLDIAVRAVDVLGLDFGAVDIIISKDGKPYVLEVNTGPRLNKYGRELYSYYLLKATKIPFDITMFRRLKRNVGEYYNGLPIDYRDIERM